jgi:hypothetical protein
MNQLTPVVIDRMPGPVAAAGESASYRFLEFFTAQIRNPNTRRAYARAAVEFFEWLAARGVTQLAAIESVHVAAYIGQLQKARSAPTAKLRLAALHHLLDWMVFLIVGAVALLALAPPCEAKKNFEAWTNKLTGSKSKTP